MKKKFFEDPEMEVVRFDPRDIYTATSGQGAGHDFEDGGTVEEDDDEELDG